MRSASGAQRGHVGKTSHKTLRVQARMEEDHTGIYEDRG